jgi:hypothetical protein
MNGECCPENPQPVHNLSTFCPQLAPLSPLKRLQSTLLCSLCAIGDAKRKENKGFWAPTAKNLGARCGQGALHGRGEENWVCAKFPYSPTTLDRWR